MIIYGWGERKLKMHPMRKCHCPECKEQGITFHFFKKYFHIFWIPMFPYSKRSVAICEKCDAGFSGKGMPDELKLDLMEAKAKTKPALILYSGLALLFILIILITTLSNGMKTYHYESGAKQAKGKMDGNLMQGEWTFWYENGNIENIQYYTDGKEDSIWTWYNEDGSINKTGSYKNGMYHGKWVFYNEEGNIVEESNFYENRLQGKLVGFYNNGQKNAEGRYDRDHETGLWTYWYENGQISETGNFVDGEKNGLWTSYFDNGQKSGETYFSKDGSMIRNVWNENGTQQVKNGQGHVIYHYDNGNIQSEGDIKDGKNSGLWADYFENGQIMNKIEYRDEKAYLINCWEKDGTQIVKNGNGNYSSYSDDGIIQAEGSYANGLKEGHWIYYNQYGTKLQETVYKNGKINGTMTGYFEDGAVNFKGDFADDEKTGLWTWYFANGTKECEVEFVNGQKEGIQTFWSESAVPVKKEYYENGVLTKEEKL